LNRGNVEWRTTGIKIRTHKIVRTPREETKKRHTKPQEKGEKKKKRDVLEKPEAIKRKKKNWKKHTQKGKRVWTITKAIDEGGCREGGGKPNQGGRPHSQWKCTKTNWG